MGVECVDPELRLILVVFVILCLNRLELKQAESVTCFAVVFVRVHVYVCVNQLEGMNVNMIIQLVK